jgi:hypothetical protein
MAETMNEEMQAWLEAKRHVTAHHRAGHAVAAVLVGGEVEHVRLVGDLDADRWGNTRSTMMPRVDTRAFATFAGPWADARVRWPDGLPLDKTNADGRTFSQCVAEAFAVDYVDGDDVDLDDLDALGVEPEYGGDDLQCYLWVWENDRVQAAIRSGKLKAPKGFTWPTRGVYEAEWCQRLEKAWPAIQAVAALLLEYAELTGDEVEAIVERTLPEGGAS